MVPPGAVYLGSEIPFAVEGPGFEIAGTLDALYSVFGRLLLVDRKTVASLPGKARRDITAIGPQPYFYSWAVLSEFGHSGLDVAYHYARRPAKGEQPGEPIKTCVAVGALDQQACRAYLERVAAPVVSEMLRVRRLPVYSTSVNVAACFDFGGCPYRHHCAYGPKKDFDA